MIQQAGCREGGNELPVQKVRGRLPRIRRKTAIHLRVTDRSKRNIAIGYHWQLPSCRTLPAAGRHLERTSWSDCPSSAREIPLREFRSGGEKLRAVGIKPWPRTRTRTACPVCAHN